MKTCASFHIDTILVSIFLFSMRPKQQNKIWEKPNRTWNSIDDIPGVQSSKLLYIFPFTRIQRVSNQKMTNDKLNLSTNISFLFAKLCSGLLHFVLMMAAWLEILLGFKSFLEGRLFLVLYQTCLSYLCRSIGRWRYSFSNPYTERP